MCIHNVLGLFQYLYNSFAFVRQGYLYLSPFAAWETILTFSADEKHLGAKSGMIAILHTWGQTLTLHPHLHCIVPAGGLTKAGFWKHSRTDGKFLFPVKAMSIVYMAKFIEKLRAKTSSPDPKLINDLFKKKWVIYAKRPFGGPHFVLEYLGRYTHKIAISNHRIYGIDNNSISFSYKDYRKGGLSLYSGSSSSF